MFFIEAFFRDVWKLMTDIVILYVRFTLSNTTINIYFNTDFNI